ncbi:MAG: transglycosylase domain-containing protein [Syntrophobacteraceae bacterium]|jgi:membrane peptidoglycan carboxypeptidase
MRKISSFSFEKLLFQPGFLDIGQPIKRSIPMARWSGWEAAARNLFEEKLDNLSHSQVALLMAMIRSPRSYDPACHPEKALDARNRFLQKMKEAALLGDEELGQAISMPLGVSSACEQSQ